MKLSPSANKDSLTLLISNPDRLALTFNINQLIDEIKNIEISQLEKAMPEYQLSINRANQYFILLGILNILFILFAFVCARPFLASDK